LEYFLKAADAFGADGVFGEDGVGSDDGELGVRASSGYEEEMGESGGGVSGRVDPAARSNVANPVPGGIGCIQVALVGDDEVGPGGSQKGVDAGVPDVGGPAVAPERLVGAYEDVLGGGFCFKLAGEPGQFVL